MLSTTVIYLMCFVLLLVFIAVQAAAIPPTDWLFKNIYVKNDNVRVRDVQGKMISPHYDPTYSS